MSTNIANVHDAFFKQALTDRMHADSFLREHLPSEVAELLDSDIPEPVPGSFVDDELRQHYTDLLLRVRLKKGKQALAYVLVEHKSQPDPGARLQLLRYVIRVLEQSYIQNDKKLPLPPVIPLLAHQGEEGWKISCEFADLFGSVPDSLRPFLPSFRHALVDLAAIEDPALSDNQHFRAFLKALKHVRRKDHRETLTLVLSEAEVLYNSDIVEIVTYLDKAWGGLDQDVLREVLAQLVPNRREEIMGPLTQPSYEKGKAEGKAEGSAEVLSRLLVRRFGELPDSFRQQIFAADISSIEHWVEKAFAVANVEAVFNQK